MRARRRRATIGIAGLVAAVLVAGSARAITYGEPDVNPVRYPEVGGLVVEVQRGAETLRGVICTGTFLDDDVAATPTFLTAAHCLTPTFAPGDVITRFGATFDADVDPLGVVIWATAAYVSPEWGLQPAGDGGDVGVVLLSASPGMKGATLAEPGYLDGFSSRALRQSVFTTAGYGTTRLSQQGGNWAIVGNDIRQRATQSYQSKSASILKLSMNPNAATFNGIAANGGTCYGDSGGPHFHDGVIVSITSTGDAPCKNLDTTYRVDTRSVHDLVDDPESYGVEVWSDAA